MQKLADLSVFENLQSGAHNAMGMSQMSVFNYKHTFNGARAAYYQEKLNELRDESGPLDQNQLELPDTLADVIGSWDERDREVARQFFDAVATTRRRVGKDTQAKAQQLLAEIDQQPVQKKLPIEDDRPQRQITESESDKLERAKRIATGNPDKYDEKGNERDYDERPSVIKEQLDDIKRTIPKFDEIKKWEDSQNTPALRRWMFDAQDRFEQAEMKLAQLERRFPYSKDPVSESEYIEKARQELAEYQAKFEKEKARFEAASDY